MVTTVVDLTYAEALILYRRRVGLSQGDLAAAVGITTATVSRYERGRGHPLPGSIIDRALRERFVAVGIGIKEEDTTR